MDIESEPGEINRLAQANLELRAELNDIDVVLRMHEDKQCIACGGSRAYRLKCVLAEYGNRTVDVIAGSKQFRDELLVSAKALSLVVQMAGNASTHREKDARLRGVSELLESWIQKLEREQFEYLGNNGRFAPFHLVDFPTRHFKERILELEAQLKALQKPAAQTEAKEA